MRRQTPLSKNEDASPGFKSDEAVLRSAQRGACSSDVKIAPGRRYRWLSSEFNM